MDRNGRWVTRHVKGNSASGQSNGIPAPSVHYYDSTTAVEHFMEVMNERGAASGNVREIAGGLVRVNEETRIMVMTALDEYPDYRSTYTLCFALQSDDEQFIRTTSLSAGFCSDYISAMLHRDVKDSPSRNALALLRGLHESHKNMITGGEFEVSNYDSGRDDTIATTFKAQALAEFMNMKHKLPFHSEYYRQFGALTDNMPLIEDAVHGIIDVTTASRKWAAQNGLSRRSASFDANDAIAIAEIVRDYPHANERLYDIVVDRGNFDPAMVKLALEDSSSPSLVRGML